MKRSWTQAPFHPFLFAAYPVLYLYWKNIGSVFASQTLRPLAISLGIVGLLLGLLRLIFRDVTRAALTLTVFVVLFFNFDLMRRGVGHFTSLPRTTVAAVLFAAVVLAAAFLAWKIADKERHLPQVLNFAGAALVLMTVSVILYTRHAEIAVSQATRAAGRAESAAMALRPERTPPPDIYYIIVDGFGRADVLKELYGEDISDFTSYLTRKGFYVASAARSNYAQTLLSLGSSLNMEYLTDLPGLPAPPSTDRKPLLRLLRRNRVCRLLKSLGYTVVLYASGYSTTEQLPGDIRATGPVEMTLFEQGLIHTTLFGALESIAHRQHWLLNWLPPARHRDLVLYALGNMGRVPANRHPELVIAHIWCPHPPFVFDRQGRAKPQPSWNLADGITGRRTVGQYREEYAAQVGFMTSRLTGMIDRILAESKTPPIILLQADHGPGSGLDQNEAAKSDLHERMSILSAYYLPEGPQGLYPGITPVNSFRLVLNQYFGAHYPLLPDVSRFSAWTSPYRFVTYDPASYSPPTTARR